MTRLELDEILQCAIESASAGSDELERRYGRDLVIREKSSAEDFVTDADEAAERAVRDVISRKRPRDSVTGEELDPFEVENSKVRWSIDPLDGTVNYSRGLPYFATSVGAVDIETGVWLAGAVVAPALGFKYFASRGGGAFKESTSGKLRIFGPPGNRVTRIVGTGFSYSMEERREQFALLPDTMEQFVDVRRMGSAALDICMVAEGSLDAYFEKHTKEHDWAAAMLIAEESGCLVKRPTKVDETAYVNFGQGLVI
jgi:myo-inositol-1(or 4)-monophosphatase